MFCRNSGLRLAGVFVIAMTLSGCEETIRAVDSGAGTGFEGVKRLASNCTPGDYDKSGAVNADYELTNSAPLWHDYEPRDDNIVSAALSPEEDEPLIESITFSNNKAQLVAIFDFGGKQELKGNLYVADDGVSFCFFGDVELSVDEHPASGYIYGRGQLTENLKSFEANLQIGVTLKEPLAGMEKPSRTTGYVNIKGKRGEASKTTEETEND